MAAKFVTSFWLRQQRVYGDVVRVLYGHPGAWQIHVQPPGGANTCIATRDKLPTYQEIEVSEGVHIHKGTHDGPGVSKGPCAHGRTHTHTHTHRWEQHRRRQRTLTHSTYVCVCVCVCVCFNGAYRAYRQGVLPRAGLIRDQRTEQSQRTCVCVCLLPCRICCGRALTAVSTRA